MPDTTTRLDNDRMQWLWAQWRPLLALLLYAGLCVIVTWPIAGRLGTHIPGSEGDAWIHFWTFNWIKQSLLSGQELLYTRLLFYPAGVSLLYHNIAWVNIALWLPLQALVGAGAAYSLVFMAVFALNGFATYLLARDVAGSEVAAFIGGLVCAFWPYTLSHHDHPNLIFICWIPLALLYLRRTFNGKRKRDALLTGIFLALIAITRWQLVVMAGFIIGLYVVYRFATDKTSRTLYVLSLLLAASLIAGLLIAPLFAPVVVAQLRRENPEELFVEEEIRNSDLAAYFVPSRYHPLWGENVFRLHDNLGANAVFVAFMGYTTLLLAIYGAVAAWPRSRFWLLAALLYLILALGTELRINGHIIPIPMPYAWIDELFLVKTIRHPSRLNVILSIPVALLVVLGITSLQRYSRSKRHSWALTGAIGFLILSEYLVTYPTLPLATPAWYQELARQPGFFGVLDIPMHPRARPDKQYMFYQLTHGKALVEGHVSRPPREAYTFIESIPLLNHLGPDEKRPPDLVNVSEQLRLLAQANIPYLILHKAFLSAEEMAAWRSWLIVEPYHEDNDLVVFRTDPVLGRDFYLSQEMVLGDDSRVEIGLIRTTTFPTSTTQTGQIQVDAYWGSGISVGENYDVCLNLISHNNKTWQSHCTPVASTWPTSRWHANETVHAVYTFHTSPFLETGTYTVTMALRNEANVPVGRSAVAGSFHLEAVPRVFAQPKPAIVSGLNWDDVISLPGYDLSVDPATLTATFYWQAKRRMDTSYKYFLHLIDPATGDIVAQVDMVPRNWSYPTNWWEQGEVVADTVSLSLAEVPSGEYVLSLGLYDLVTGERLPAYSAAGERFPDDVVPLTTLRLE